MERLKLPLVDAVAEDRAVRAAVEAMLGRIRKGGEQAVREIAAELDKWDGDFVLSSEKKAALIAAVPENEKEDIRFAHTQIRRFAEAQRDSIREFSIVTEPGVVLGQKLVPVACAGCYVPGGRYAHAASALMSVATAKAAGVPFIIAASPPRGTSIAPAVAYAMDLAGADMILEMGGVQAIAAMAFGLFGAPPADILAGPGNAYVAEAKRQVFGHVGIDMIAGPSEVLVVADSGNDPDWLAADLLAQ
ncbi:MAG: histidinol dehydrogenase, partial [Nitratireductor sp.]|nr:histidinol dehydrogenase [Nitratireductor sp.]